MTETTILFLIHFVGTFDCHSVLVCLVHVNKMQSRHSKLNNSLKSFMFVEKERIKAERIAATKTAIAKATDARALVAKAAIAVSESNLLAGECEADAADAATTAARAQELAQMARKDVEDAKIAADEKRKSEEIARERAAERARKKAEEEKKKRIEEDKQIAAEARRRGVSFIDEKKRNLTEKARKETERRNPKNWPRVL